MTRTASALALAALVLTSSRNVLAQEGPQPEPTWSISHLRGDVYRVRADGQATLFVAASDGLLLVDPFNTRVAAWLAKELADRFPNRPVRYIVYSHHDERRVSGAARFQKGVEIVAHHEFESEGTRTRARLGLPRERYTHSVVRPVRTFRQRLVISLSTTTVELIHVPHADATDMTVVYFPRERLVFAPDWLTVRSLPNRIGSDPRRTIAAAAMVESLDFDAVVTSDGTEGTRGDVMLFREYLEELLSGVKAAVRAGYSAEKSKHAVTLDRFAGWSNYATQRDANIAAMHRVVRPVVTSLQAAAHLNFQGFNTYTCDRWMDFCDVTSRSMLPGGVIAAVVEIGRMTVSAELATGRTALRRARQTDSFIRVGPYESVLEHRASVLSLLVGRSLIQRRGLTLAVDGGPAYLFTTNGLTSLAPSRSTFHASHGQALGFSAGATLEKPVSNRVSVVVPTRLTGARRGTSDVRFISFSIAAGLRVNVARGAR